MFEDLLRQLMGSRVDVSPEPEPFIEPAVRELVRSILAGEDPESRLDAIAALSEPAQGQALLAVAAEHDALARAWRTKSTYTGADIRLINGYSGVLSRLMRRRVQLADAQVAWLARRAAASTAMSRRFPDEALVGFVERHLGGRRAEGELAAALAATRRLHDQMSDASSTKKLLARLDAMLTGPKAFELAPEPLASRVATDLAAASAPARDAWNAVLVHAASASGAKPSGKWKVEMRRRLDAVPDAVARFADWLGAAASSGTFALGGGVPHDNDDCLKGLAWAAGLTDDALAARALGELADTCFRKVPQVGALRPAVANACVQALSEMTVPQAAAELSRLRSRTRKPAAARTVDKALGRVAEQAGVSPDDLEDMAVPGFGLDATGTRRETLGRHVAELRVVGRDAELRWTRDDGRSVASVPADVKRDHAGELEALKSAVKDIQRFLPAVRDRLERSYLHERAWTAGAWRERLLDHPLTGTVARRLIWSIDVGGGPRDVAWLDGNLAGVDGRSLPALAGDEVVRLWHPLLSEPDRVRAWREWLMAHAITQPFKQAHRETYVVTDAERATMTHSNRFASHVLRQHQLAALCDQRGWAYRLQGAWDGGGDSSPTLRLPRHDLQVEFWVDGAGVAGTTGAGILLEVVSDQVRFTDGAGSPRRLEEIPPLVFSEVMRDIDLFVGVTSIGTDPTWRDRGADRGAFHVAYWQERAFGELAEAAAIRREVLQGLLPKLAIASRCSIDGRFLRVQGRHGAYKIHLGSGNVLMEPNDSYLCIVQDHSKAADRVFLPFEGDAMLSIILSKAFLLAADDRIADPSILSQMGRA